MIQAEDVPQQTRTREGSLSSFTNEQIETAIALLDDQKQATDGVVYDKARKKMEPRLVAYYRGWYLRNAVISATAERDGGYQAKSLKVETIADADGDGFRWFLRRK